MQLHINRPGKDEPLRGGYAPAHSAKPLDEFDDTLRQEILPDEEFSYEEIANIMGCPIGTVMSRLHRGRKLLQRSLYSHALALGIVKAEADPGGNVSTKKQEAPADLTQYRAKKRGAA